MRVWRAADRAARPWKNDGGITREVVAFPADAGLDAFEWRISMADVSRDGPFSLFAGVDRLLTVVEGAGLLLEFAGQAKRLYVGSPLAFPGEAEVTARLIAGPIRDFNVMVRRGFWRAELSNILGGCTLAAPDGPLLALILDAAVAAQSGASYHLARFDVLHLDRGETAALHMPAGSRGLTVALRPVIAPRSTMPGTHTASPSGGRRAPGAVRPK